MLVDMPDVDPDAVGLVAFHQLQSTGSDNDPNIRLKEKITGRVLGVSRREGVVDIGARPSLGGAKVGKRAPRPAPAAGSRSARLPRLERISLRLALR